MSVIWIHEIIRNNIRELLYAAVEQQKAGRQHFTEQFAAHGIETERVVMTPYLFYTEYMAMYGKVGIVLDSFQSNGHTTTCDSLLMGVPVITMRREPDCSRVGASILTRVGLPELIVADRQDYISKAVQLAEEPGRLCA